MQAVGSNKSMQCFLLLVSLQASHAYTRTTEMTTVRPALAHGLSQLHICFVGLFAFCLNVVRDYRMEPKCCPLFAASQIHAADRQPLTGAPLICVHVPYPQFELTLQQSSQTHEVHNWLHSYFLLSEKDTGL